MAPSDDPTVHIELDPGVRPTISVDEAAIVLGIGRASAYEGVRRGQIPSIRVGKRIRVPVAGLRRMLELDTGGAA